MTEDHQYENPTCRCGNDKSKRNLYFICINCDQPTTLEYATGKRVPTDADVRYKNTMIRLARKWYGVRGGE